MVAPWHNNSTEVIQIISKIGFVVAPSYTKFVNDTIETRYATSQEH